MFAYKWGVTLYRFNFSKQVTALLCTKLYVVGFHTYSDLFLDKLGAFGSLSMSHIP